MKKTKNTENKFESLTCFKCLHKLREPLCEEVCETFDEWKKNLIYKICDHILGDSELYD